MSNALNTLLERSIERQRARCERVISEAQELAELYRVNRTNTRLRRRLTKYAAKVRREYANLITLRRERDFIRTDYDTIVHALNA